MVNSIEKSAYVIALVEDEEDYRSNVAAFLESQGFEVWTAGSAEIFYRQLIGRHTDLVIVDLGLPGEDGLSLISHLHAHSELAIIALTARGTPADQKAGLDAGADYYFVKPVDPNLLVSGIHSVLRKRSGLSAKVVAEPSVWTILRTEAELLTPTGMTVSLTSRELQLLEVVMANAGRVITKVQLLELCTQHPDDCDFNRIEATVSRLRGKVMTLSGLRLPLRSVYGHGLSFIGSCLMKA